MRPLAWAYLAAAYAFIFLPVVVLVAFSFQDGRLPVPPLRGVTLDWYAKVLSDRAVVAALWNSLAVAAVSSLVALVLGFLAAHAFARVRLPGSAALRTLIVAPMAVSSLIIGLGLLSVFNGLGIRPSLVTAGIGHVVINLPLCFAILYAAMGDHQRAAERAARDLGASEARVLWLVSAPMLAPALAAAFFLSLTFSWDEFIIAFLLTRFDVTLPVEIWSMLRSGLSPAINAVGALVFLISAGAVVLAELLLLRRRT
ncbi:MAG: ABC transporter permease [Rhodobacteraceae bacterium]|nr:ABC transporter permease [Paracoccaceae bacterium]